MSHNCVAVALLRARNWCHMLIDAACLSAQADIMAQAQRARRSIAQHARYAIQATIKRAGK